MTNTTNFPTPESAELEVDQVTQEYLDAIHKVVESSEELKRVADLPNERPAGFNVVADRAGVEMEEVVMEKNLLTGETRQLGTLEDFNKLKGENPESVFSITDILEGKVPETVEEAIVLKPEELKLQIKDEVGSISDEDVEILMDVVKFYQANPKTTNLASKMPPKIITSIKNELLKNGVAVNPKMLNMYSEHLITNIITGAKIDRFQVEFQEDMRKIQSEGSEEIIAHITNQFRGDTSRYDALKPKLEEEGKLDALERLNKINDTMLDAVHFVSFKEVLKERKVKIKKFDLEKPEKVLKGFDMKFEKSPYKIKSIYCIPAVLDRVLDKEVNGKYINLFTLLFAKYTECMKVSVPEDYAMMYYTVSTITYLDITSDDEAFNTEKNRVINDILECIEIIKEKYQNLI